MGHRAISGIEGSVGSSAHGRQTVDGRRQTAGPRVHGWVDESYTGEIAVRGWRAGWHIHVQRSDHLRFVEEGLPVGVVIVVARPAAAHLLDSVVVEVRGVP